MTCRHFDAAAIDIVRHNTQIEIDAIDATIAELIERKKALRASVTNEAMARRYAVSPSTIKRRVNGCR